MIYLHRYKTDFAISRGFYFCETPHLRSFAKIKTLAKISELTVYTQYENDKGHISLATGNELQRQVNTLFMEWNLA